MRDCRRCPYAGDTALCGRQTPCQGAAIPATGAAAPTGGRVGRSQPCLWVAAPCGLLPLRAAAPCRGPGHSRSPLVGSQVMAGRPCRGPGRGQPPLHADSMPVAAPPMQAVSMFAANRCNKHVE
ncbi:hypothetical protein BHM03_00055241 [Ensete ventricosum]|nr:hypothetical protein BHM03_00055241 [Ensete ventricosum]